MKSQRLDRDVSPIWHGAAYPGGTAPETSIADAVQRLCRKLQQRFPAHPSRTEQRLNWFIGLYLASLLSFSGLISAVRWTLERI